MTASKPEKREYPVIWLQPWCDDCARHDTSDTGRTWCANNVYDDCECGQKPIKYLLAAPSARARMVGNFDDGNRARRSMVRMEDMT